MFCTLGKDVAEVYREEVLLSRRGVTAMIPTPNGEIILLKYFASRSMTWATGA